MSDSATSVRADEAVEHAFVNTARLASTAGFMTRLAYEHARKTGLPANALARRAGLTPEIIEDWRVRINARDQARFLDSVADAANDDSLGFRLARVADFRPAGLFFYVLASSQRLIEVFERGSRYTSLVNEGVIQRCLDRQVVGVELHSAAAGEPTNRHEMQFWITALLRLSRELTNARLAPKRVCFAHGQGRGADEIGQYFGCEIEYSAPHDLLVFTRAERELQIVNADPYLNRLLTDYCEAALRRERRPRAPFESMVENAIATLLPHGQACVKAVAARLNMSERSLARKLAAQGVKFSVLRTRLRRSLAQRYLTEPELSISEIAWLLGFQDVSTFSHAFKRWTGKTPREMRSESTLSSTQESESRRPTWRSRTASRE